MLNTKTRKSRKSAQLYLFALKKSRKEWKQLQPWQITVTYKTEIIAETDKILSEISEFSNLP